MNVIGTACALASSSTSQSCWPDRESNARNLRSVLAPTNTRPLAVIIGPPMFNAPVWPKPLAFNSSTNPSGTFHAMSPEFTSTATSSPNGGAEHGILFSGFQNLPTEPPHGVLLAHVIGPSALFRSTIFATWPRFITFVTSRPSSGSYANPFQLPPPSVLGNVTIMPSVPAGVNGPLASIPFVSHNCLQYAACSGVSV